MDELPVEAVLEEGRVLGGRWRIVRCIRTGGMGTVYEAVHRETRARCAVKVMRSDLVTSDELRVRFKQEAMITATIQSDHIVKIFDGGTDIPTGAPFLVMEFLEGEDLGARIARVGAVRGEEAIALLRQVSRALERTHAASVVHRDLKPENLFLTTRDDGTPCVKVLDFGIAKFVASASKAETTRTVGTPLYMAPEQVKGDGSIGSPADVYALAHIAYALLVGKPYWADERAQHESVYPLLMAITAGAKESATARALRGGVTLPPAFAEWFAKATAVAAGDRFASSHELIRELARIYLMEEAEPREASLAAPLLSPATAAVVPEQSMAGVARDTPASRPTRTLALATVLGLGVVIAIALWVRGSQDRSAISPVTSTAAMSSAANETSATPGAASPALTTTTPVAPTASGSPTSIAIAPPSSSAIAPPPPSRVLAPARTTKPSDPPAPITTSKVVHGPSDPSDEYPQGKP